jgi:cell division protein FtsQ
VWPDRLAVRLIEHEPAAWWQGDDGSERLVNSQGEVFEANAGDVDEHWLPTLAGPDGSSVQLLALYRRLQPLFDAGGMRLSLLKLSGRGSWRAEFDDGAVIHIGRGSDDELVARCARFLRTVGQVSGRYAAAIEHADLRHAQGYALRLRGVTTTPAASAPAATAARKKN